MFKAFRFKHHEKDIYINNMRISNTYLVKLKIEKHGVYSFNPHITLVENINILYFNNFIYRIQIKQIGDISIEEVHSSYGEKFLFLRSHKDLILLNYINGHEAFNPVENYYIPELSFEETKNHVVNISFSPLYKFTNWNCKIINLHDVFKSFPSKNICYMGKNSPFFANFIESLFWYIDINSYGEEKNYSCIDEVLNTNQSIYELRYTKLRFYYYNIDNVYIISDYK